MGRVQVVRQLKYRNLPTVVDGVRFQSRKEARRWQDLKILERAGKIKDLMRQVRYELIPKQVGERQVLYIADFVYMERGKLVVEDCKSPASRTPAYIIKRKLMLHMHGIRIKEV